MPIQVSWGNEQKSYTLFRFENKWTWDEYHRAIYEGTELTRGCGYTANVLVDMTDCHLFPQNLLSNIRSSVMQHAHETDLVVVVTTSRFVEMLLHTLGKVTGKQWLHLRLARSREEGERILAEYERQNPITPPAPAAGSISATVPAAPTSLPE
ncbi:MAG: hypothetical protein IT319_20090 [Anaerolineae bacterium]|nr:hypothetical protein [Anaerolineae bacterium]